MKVGTFSMGLPHPCHSLSLTIPHTSARQLARCHPLMDHHRLCTFAKQQMSKCVPCCPAPFHASSSALICMLSFVSS